MKLTKKITKKAEVCIEKTLQAWHQGNLAELMENTTLSWRSRNSILALENLPAISDYKILKISFATPVIADALVNLQIKGKFVKYNLRFISETAPYVAAVKTGFWIFAKQNPFRFNPDSLRPIEFKNKK